MHRQRAHFACRVGFVLLCVLPTAAVAGWIVQRTLPGFVLSDRQEWEQELSRQMGLRVSCAGVQYPQPNTARLTEVAIADPETGTPIASLAALEVIVEEAGWKVTGWQGIIETTQLPVLKNQFEQRWLRRESRAGTTKCEIEFRELTFRGPDQSLTLVDVTGAWQFTAAGPECELTFRLPESNPQGPRGRWIVQRNRETTPPTTRWQVDTGEIPLPCSLAAPGWPRLKEFGPAAEFAGHLEVVQSGEQTAGRLRGVVHKLDFDSLVSEHSNHRLRGLAVAKIEHAEFAQDQLLELRGTLQARDGYIDSSLLVAASQQLQLITSPAVQQNAAAPIFFRQLALGFDLQEGTLRLSGSADPLRANVLIATGSGPLLEIPPQHRTSQQALATLFRIDGAATNVARRPNRMRLGPATDSKLPPVKAPELR